MAKIAVIWRICSIKRRKAMTKNTSRALTERRRSCAKRREMFTVKTSMVLNAKRSSHVGSSQGGEGSHPNNMIMTLQLGVHNQQILEATVTQARPSC